MVVGTSAVSLVDPAAVDQQLARILSSPQLQNSDQLRQFLSFVVRKAIAGEADQIKEYAIATDVFGRSRGFDPRMDTIVRVQASKLRNRLAEYYAGPGAQDRIFIELPRGSYVPSFAERESPAPQPEPPGPPATRHFRFRLMQVLPWAVAAVCAAGFLGALRRPTASPQVVRFFCVPAGRHSFRWQAICFSGWPLPVGPPCAQERRVGALGAAAELVIRRDAAGNGRSGPCRVVRRLAAGRVSIGGQDQNPRGRRSTAAADHRRAASLICFLVCRALGIRSSPAPRQVCTVSALPAAANRGGFWNSIHSAAKWAITSRRSFLAGAAFFTTLDQRIRRTTES